MAVPLQSAGNDSLCLVEVAKVTRSSWQKDGDEMRDHICVKNILEDVRGKRRGCGRRK